MCRRRGTPSWREAAGTQSCRASGGSPAEGWGRGQVPNAGCLFLHVVLGVEFVGFGIEAFLLVFLELLDALGGGEGSHDHDHSVTGQLGCLVHLAHGLEVLLHLGHFLQTELLVSIFAHAEAEAEAHLVAVIQELFGACHLDVVVIDVGTDTDDDLLHASGLSLVRLLELGLHVLVLTVVDDAADGWVRIGCDLYQIEADFLSLGEGLTGGEDAELLTLGIDHAHARGADAVIDAGLLGFVSGLIAEVFVAIGLVVIILWCWHVVSSLVLGFRLRPHRATAGGKGGISRLAALAPG